MATDAFFPRGQQRDENVANRWKALRFDPARMAAFVRAELERRVRIAPQLGLKEPAEAWPCWSVRRRGEDHHDDEARGIRCRRRTPAAVDLARYIPLAGHVQLQSFASNLESLSRRFRRSRLPALVEEARKKKEMVLIDTPGYAGNDTRSAELAATVFGCCAHVDVHLVVPGYMKARDLRRCLQRYQIFRPSKLLVTKLDETQSSARHSRKRRAPVGDFVPDAWSGHTGRYPPGVPWKIFCHGAGSNARASRGRRCEARGMRKVNGDPWPA